ncbi:MAG: hypothetical protein ACRDN0_25020, partial [Trebonia sp.]
SDMCDMLAPMNDDAAPRNRFRSFSPVFPVRDMRRALAHYASLGFTAQGYADGDGYGFAERDEVSLHLSLDEGHGPEAGHEHVARARPLILSAWSVCTGRTTPTDAMTATAETRALTEMIATRARAAVAGR